MGKLDDKVAIVTGASSGIGEAITKRFAQEGAMVVAIARRKDKLQGIIDKITAAGGKAVAVAGDVTREEDVQNAVKTAVDTFGKLDIVVNNAGVLDKLDPVGETDDETWQYVLDVNVTGPMRFYRAAIPEMLKQGKGVFVTVASVASLYGMRGGAAYTTAKHAALGLSRNTAFMYAKKGIRSNVIAPGFIETEMTESLGTADLNQESMSLLSAGLELSPRNGSSDEIAGLALCLASDDTSYVNGATVVADGGWSSY